MKKISGSYWIRLLEESARQDQHGEVETCALCKAVGTMAGTVLGVGWPHCSLCICEEYARDHGIEVLGRGGTCVAIKDHYDCDFKDPDSIRVLIYKHLLPYIKAKGLRKPNKRGCAPHQGLCLVHNEPLVGKLYCASGAAVRPELTGLRAKVKGGLQIARCPKCERDFPIWENYLETFAAYKHCPYCGKRLGKIKGSK